MEHILEQFVDNKLNVYRLASYYNKKLICFQKIWLPGEHQIFTIKGWLGLRNKPKYDARKGFHAALKPITPHTLDMICLKFEANRQDFLGVNGLYVLFRKLKLTNIEYQKAIEKGEYNQQCVAQQIAS